MIYNFKTNGFDYCYYFDKQKEYTNKTTANKA